MCNNFIKYWIVTSESRLGSDTSVLPFGVCRSMKKDWVLVDIYTTDWWQEGHPASKSLHQLPRMECTFPPILFLHRRPFYWQGHGVIMKRENRHVCTEYKNNAIIIRGYSRSREVTQGHEVYSRSSEVTQGHQRLLKVTRGDSRSSEVTQGHERLLKVIRGYSRSREVTQGHQRLLKVTTGYSRSSEVTQGHQRWLKVIRGLLKVIRGDSRSSVVI